MYEHHYLSSWIGGSHAIQHHRLYISGSGDGISGETEVTYGRYNKAAQYQGGLIMVRFYFRILFFLPLEILLHLRATQKVIVSAESSFSFNLAYSVIYFPSVATASFHL